MVLICGGPEAPGDPIQLGLKMIDFFVVQLGVEVG